MSSTPQPAGVSVATPTAESTMTSKQLRRLRWAVRATLPLGVAASVAANVLHARPNPITQLVAVWPPLALLPTVELVSRVLHELVPGRDPCHRRPHRRVCPTGTWSVSPYVQLPAAVDLSPGFRSGTCCRRLRGDSGICLTGVCRQPSDQTRQVALHADSSSIRP